MSQVASHISPQTQYDYLRAFGLGQTTGLGLPGESAGLLPPVSQWCGRHPVHAVVRPGRGRDRDADGRGVRDDRERRRPGAADPGRGHHQLRGHLHRGRAVAVQAGHPGQDGAANCCRSCSRCPRSTPRAASPGGSFPATRSPPRPAPRRRPTGHARCASTDRATSAWRQATTRSSWSRSTCRTRARAAISAMSSAGPVFYQVMKYALATLKIPPDGAVPAKVRLTAP